MTPDLALAAAEKCGSHSFIDFELNGLGLLAQRLRRLDRALTGLMFDVRHVGVLGSGPVAGSIVDALKRLEYRGYDSAGVATLENGKLERRRAEGKLRNFEAKLAAAPLFRSIGIGQSDVELISTYRASPCVEERLGRLRSSSSLSLS